MEERMDFRILNNGSFIPSIGYGTYKTGTEGETEQAVANALGVGYRLLRYSRLLRQRRGCWQGHQSIWC